MVQQKPNQQMPSQKSAEKQQTRPQNEQTRSAPPRGRDQDDSRK